MLDQQLDNIKEALNTFIGKDREPKGDAERYILKASWVMLCAEFEGCFKEMMLEYFSNINKFNDLEKIHPLLIIKGKSKNTKFSIEELINIFKAGDNTINFEHILPEKSTFYKYDPVIKLLNSIGIFFTTYEISEIKLLDGIATTRDSIAHGNRSVEITRKELEYNIGKIKEIYHLLESKLSN